MSDAARATDDRLERGVRGGRSGRGRGGRWRGGGLARCGSLFCDAGRRDRGRRYAGRRNGGRRAGRRDSGSRRQASGGGDRRWLNSARCRASTRRRHARGGGRGRRGRRRQGGARCRRGDRCCRHCLRGCLGGGRRPRHAGCAGSGGRATGSPQRGRLRRCRSNLGGRSRRRCRRRGRWRRRRRNSLGLLPVLCVELRDNLRRVSVAVGALDVGEDGATGLGRARSAAGLDQRGDRLLRRHRGRHWTRWRAGSRRPRSVAPANGQQRIGALLPDLDACPGQRRRHAGSVFPRCRGGRANASRGFRAALPQPRTISGASRRPAAPSPRSRATRRAAVRRTHRSASGRWRRRVLGEPRGPPPTSRRRP